MSREGAYPNFWGSESFRESYYGRARLTDQDVEG